MSTTDALKQQIAPAAAQQQTAVAERPNRPVTLIDVVRSTKFQKQMSLAMPKSMTPDRLTRIVMTECRKTPALLKCAPESFYGAVLQCAALGLEPGSALGHCYLLPFGNGKDRSGQIISLQAWTVHAQDTFNYQLGLEPDIQHVPASTADRGPVTHVYAVAKLKGGGIQFEVMSRAEIEKVRSTSKAGNSGPWASHWDEMAKKTVIRRLFKYLPVSIEAVRAVEIDEKTDRGEATTDQDFLDAEFIEKGDFNDAPQIEAAPEEPAE